MLKAPLERAQAEAAAGVRRPAVRALHPAVRERHPAVREVLRPVVRGQRKAAGERHDGLLKSVPLEKSMRPESRKDPGAPAPRAELSLIEAAGVQDAKLHEVTRPVTGSLGRQLVGP